MYDFNSKTLLRLVAGQGVVGVIDRALLRAEKEKPQRDYLGASYLGGECERAIQYQYAMAEKDPDRAFTARTLRIFARGHTMEDEVSGWLRLAGFQIEALDEMGEQFGFVALDGEFAGHCDGKLVGWQGDEPCPVELPALWEAKCVNAKNFKLIVTKGLKKAKPVYYGQAQLYMYYLGLTENPCVFTVLNADTMEMHVELIAFDPAEVQRLLDRAAHIVGATKAGELLPRCSTAPDKFPCTFCDHRARCWAAP